MTVDELRAEFRPVDLIYVRTHHPNALRAARAYRDARALINPSDGATITRARKRLARLMETVQANGA